MMMENSEYAKIIANNLRRIMYENGKTQAEVSKALGISKATLSSWMNGTRIPRMPNIDLLCHYFNVSRSEIMEKQMGEKEYYANEELAKEAQEMFEDKQMRSLFHMKKNMDQKRFQAHVDMMKEMYRLEHPEDFPEDWTD